MRTKLFILALTFLFLTSVIVVFSQDKQEKKSVKRTNIEKSKETKLSESKSKDKKYWCAVMDMQGKKEINYKYKGKTYYFCCKDCLAKFKADPVKYAKK
jgi:YHS domain-containing protein